MKKLLYLLTVVVMFAMTACSDKDDEPTFVMDVNTLTAGTWYVSEIKDGKSWLDVSDEAYRVVFDKDGEYRLGYGKNWNTKFYKGKWTLNGNTVNGVTVDGVKETFKFISLSGVNATVEYTNSDSKTTITCKAIRK